MRVNWMDYSKARPAKAGTYLVAYDEGTEGAKKLFPEVGEYYLRGDLILTEMKNLKGDNAEERIIDWLFNPEHEIHADHDGFFEIDEEECWEVKPLWWAEYPEAPEGTEWAK